MDVTIRVNMKQENNNEECVCKSKYMYGLTALRLA